MRFDRNTIINQMRSGAGWYRMSNAGDDGVAHIRLYDTIGGWFGKTAKDFARELDELDASEIVVSINSLGGDVFDGIAIFNALRMKDAKIVTQVDSMAASIASVIAQAGDERHMVTGSQMMIHEAWGIAWGDAQEMRDYADLLERQTANIASIYAERSGLPAADFRELMGQETWFDASETVDQQLADRIVTPPRRTDDEPTDGEDTSNQNNRRFSEHITDVVTAVDELTNRIDSVVTLRTEDGKPIDDAWRTRADIDQLASAVTRLNEVLTADEPATPSTTNEAEAEWLRFVQTTQGV